MFKNKHVVIAMLVAPVLSIMAWFAVDHFVGERPHAAKEGSAYKLVAKSNCRYDSGQCDLENADFGLTLRLVEVTETAVELELVSRFELQQASLGLVENGTEQAPATMTMLNKDATQWSTRLPIPASDESTIRIAVFAQGATYYAEVPVVFLVTTD